MKTFKFLSLFVIASMLLAACGTMPVESGVVPPQEIPISVTETEITIRIPEVGSMDAGEVVQAGGPWVLAVGAVAVADDSTLVGILNDPLAAALVIALIAQTACSAIPDCRAAEAQVIVNSIEGMTAELQRLFPDRSVVVTYGATTIAAELPMRCEHQESHDLHNAALTAAAGSLMLRPRGDGRSPGDVQVFYSPKALASGMINVGIVLTFEGHLGFLFAGVPVSTVMTAAASTPWVVDGTTYYINPLTIKWITSYFASPEHTLRTPGQLYTIEAGWDYFWNDVNLKWGPFIPIIEVPLPPTVTSWLSRTRSWTGTRWP